MDLSIFHLFCNMFTGIVETLGTVVSIERQQQNITFGIACDFLSELKVDQSVSHNGVCLTVTEIFAGHYVVTAVAETLSKTNLGNWQIGSRVNLERCLPLNGRFDGHIVQGHVDSPGILINIEDLEGSWKLTFSHESSAGITVEKGSICVNGVSLTVVDSRPGQFSVVIIPYTWQHTNLSLLMPGHSANLEFDILGKYVQKMLEQGNYR
jgi:riboflavin synthase